MASETLHERSASSRPNRHRAIRSIMEELEVVDATGPIVVNTFGGSSGGNHQP